MTGKSSRAVMAGPAPDRAMLREAALRHLGRYATTQAGLRHVLHRRVMRWGQRAAAEGQDESLIATVAAEARLAIEAVSATLVADGLIDDAAYSAQRVRALQRSGRSSRAIAAHLIQRGISQDLLRETIPDDAEGEMEAAVLYARRRRLGPFRKPDAEEDRTRVLGAFARAGFPAKIAQAVLKLSRDDAETLALRVRQRL